MITILVVNDNAVERDAVRRLLEASAREGEQVLEASSGDALARSQGAPPDCMLLEDSALQKLNVGLDWPSVAVILLTDADEETAPSLALRAGAHDGLSKHSLTSQLLWHTIRSAVARARREREEHRRETREAAALKAGGIVTWEWDPGARQGRLGRAADALLGPRAPMRFQTISDFVDPRDSDRIEHEIERCIRSQARRFAQEFRVVRQDGSTQWVRARAQVDYSEAREGRWAGVLQELHASEQRPQAVRGNDRLVDAILQAVPLAIYTHDLKGRRVGFISRHGLEELGYTEDEIQALGPQLFDRIFHPDDAALLLEHADRLERAPDGEVVDFEHRVRTKTGSYRWMSTRVTAFARAVDGSLEQLLGVSTDVTARRGAEAELRASRASLAAAQEAAAVGTWDWDLGQNRARCSDSYFALYGLPPQTPDPSLEDWLSCVHPEDRERAAEDVRQALAGRPYESEFRVVWPDGSVHWLSARGRVLLEEGRPARFIGANVEMTQRKATEQALRESEERFRVALQNSPVVVFNQDLDLRYTWIHNPALGYRPEEVVGKRDIDIFERPEDAEATEALKRQVLETGLPLRQEVRIHHAGVARCYDLSIEPLRGADGLVRGVTCAAADITDRKLIEEALWKSEERLRIAQEAGGIGFYDWDPRTNEVFWSPRVEALFGLDPGSFESTYDAWLKRLHPDDVARVSNIVSEALRNRHERIHFEYRAVLPDGGVRWIQCLNLLFFDEQGGPIRGVGTNIDVTEQALARQNLERVNRELQQFVSIVSHDLQAPTRAVSTFGRWLEERHSSELGEEGRKLVGFIGVSAQRMLGLLRGLLAYSQAGIAPSQTRGMVDCNEILTRVLATMESDVQRYGATVRAERLPVIPGWAGQLEQLFQNLIDNALKHGRGEPPLITISSHSRESEWVFLVEDNGAGIDMSHAADIFLPFERLHARNEGSGMGLAICKRVVEQHGGRIWVESDMGKGCQFIFTIPVNQEG